MPPIKKSRYPEACTRFGALRQDKNLAKQQAPDISAKIASVRGQTAARYFFGKKFYGTALIDDHPGCPGHAVRFLYPDIVHTEIISVFQHSCCVCAHGFLLDLEGQYLLKRLRNSKRQNLQKKFDFSQNIKDFLCFQGGAKESFYSLFLDIYQAYAGNPVLEYRHYSGG